MKDEGFSVYSIVVIRILSGQVDLWLGIVELEYENLLVFSKLEKTEGNPGKVRGRLQKLKKKRNY